jgi:hypothetical protein
MVVYPFAERLAMANNIEGAMIERYGVEQGTENAIVFYRAMLDAERGELTPFGRETLADYTITSLPIWMKTAGLKCQRRMRGDMITKNFRLNALANQYAQQRAKQHHRYQWRRVLHD